MKTTEIVQKLEAKGIPTQRVNKMFGVRLGKYVWHWFFDYEDYLGFCESYSQNTGKATRGISHGMKVKSAIAKKIGVESIIL